MSQKERPSRNSSGRPARQGERPRPNAQRRPAPRRVDDFYDYDDAPRRKRPPEDRRRRDEYPQSGKRRRTHPGIIVLRWVRAILVAFLLAFVLRTFVFDLVTVNSVSMGDTLRPGDVVLMTKYDYWLASPGRQDIVAVQLDGVNGMMLSRVIGLPNDVLEIKQGEVYINETPLDEPYAKLSDDNYMIAGGIGNNYYIVLGDDRPVSSDSRNPEIGLIKRGEIVGKVRAVIWPSDRFSAVE